MGKSKSGPKGGATDKQGGGKGGGERDRAPKPCTHVKVRHVLCEKQSGILRAQAELAKGRTFEDVARELSEDKARQGGDLGWKTRQDVVGAFADAAFALGVGDVTLQPIRTQFGYHLIKCEGRK